MDQTPEKKDINLDDILLPKKEERTPASASRVNAGVLLEKEQTAELPKPAPVAPPPAPPKQEGPANETSVRSLETYQGDMESVISQKKVSVVSIAAAEAQRRGQLGDAPTAQQPGFDWKRVGSLAAVALAGGLVLLSVSLLNYVLLRPTQPVSIGQGSAAPFMAIDDTQILVMKPEQFDRETLMQNLESLKEKTSLSLGLVSRTYVVLSTSTIDQKSVPPAISVQQLLSTLAPNINSALLRTLDPNYYILGTHVFDGNQAFLVMKTDSYEQAFSGMLQWERTMPQEISPLFTRTPKPHLSTEGIVATSTPAALTATPFRDAIVANHDARAVINDQGDILLLWAFIDRNTLVITTNENTFAEIITRKSTFTPNE